MDSLETCKIVLASLAGRDKTIRTMSYALNFIAGQTTGGRHDRLTAIAKQMSMARLILRQFTDIPMIMASKAMLLKPDMEIDDVFSHRVDTLVTLLYTIYNPVEHIAYLADHKILNTDPAKWWRYCVYIWTICLIATIIKHLRNYFQLEMKKNMYIHCDSTELKEASIKQSEIAVDLTIAFADFMNAINGFPKGFLWAQTLSQSRAGFYGFVASALALYKLFRAAASNH